MCPRSPGILCVLLHLIGLRLLRNFRPGAGGGIELLSGDLGGGAGASIVALVLVLHEGEDLAGFVGLALSLIELGEP